MRKKNFLIYAALFALLMVWVLLDYYYAAAPMQPVLVDLSAVLAKEELSQEDYGLIFEQTGLGRAAVCDLRQEEADFAAAVRRFQTQLQEPLRYRQTFLFFPTTTAEQLQDETGRLRTLELPPLRRGDILITRSTKTLLYRHGHAALMLDEDTTIESLMIGSDSAVLSVDNWLSYPTLLILRPRNASAETINAAASFAEDKLTGVPYQLLTGVVKKDKSQMTDIDGTHCAHLVWQAYRQAGLDLDFDRGWLVTPHDLAGSGELEVVFAYGFGEEGSW